MSDATNHGETETLPCCHVCGDDGQDSTVTTCEWCCKPVCFGCALSGGDPDVGHFSVCPTCDKAAEAEAIKLRDEADREAADEARAARATAAPMIAFINEDDDCPF